MLTRALTAGLAVGVVLAGYVLVVVEPVIDDAIALEEEMATAAGDGTANDHDDALFTRTEQVGGGVAVSVLYAAILGVVFATVYAAIRHRLPGGTEIARTTWLAAVIFGAVALLPAIKYPASPPGVGDPDTVNDRTLAYLVVVVVGLVLAWLLTRLSGELRGRLDDPTRVVTVTLAAVACVAVLLVLLPAGPDRIDPAVPAALVWDFRIRSLGSLVVLWGGLGLGLGWLLGRVADRRCANTRAHR